MQDRECLWAPVNMVMKLKVIKKGGIHWRQASNKYFVLCHILLTYNTDRTLLQPSFDIHHRFLHPEYMWNDCDNRSWCHSLRQSSPAHIYKHSQANPYSSHGYTCCNTCPSNENVSYQNRDWIVCWGGGRERENTHRILVRKLLGRLKRN